MNINILIINHNPFLAKSQESIIQAVVEFLKSPDEFNYDNLGKTHLVNIGQSPIGKNGVEPEAEVVNS